MLTGRCAVSDFGKSRAQEQKKKKKGLEKLELRFIEFPAAAGEISEEAAASIKSGGNSLSLKNEKASFHRWLAWAKKQNKKL